MSDYQCPRFINELSFGDVALTGVDLVMTPSALMS